MGLTVTVPAAHGPELRWILSHLLERRLGLSCTFVDGAEADASCISDGTRSLELADVFFRAARPRWLRAGSVPEPGRASAPGAAPGRLPELRSDGSGPPPLPVLFGDPRVEVAPDRIRVAFDVPGACFFLLSRYEEWLPAPTDAHGRFPAQGALATRHGLLERPLVDEHVRWLAHWIGRLWPGAVRAPRDRALRVVPTHDVDRPFAWLGAPAGAVLRRCAGEALRLRPGRSLLALRDALLSRGTGGRRDPFNTFDVLMDAARTRGRRARFYLLPDTEHALDARHPLDHPALADVIRRLHAAGHELGLHPGYGTMADPEAAGRSVARWKAALGTLGVPEAPLWSRQHYLRWRFPETPRQLAALGVEEDSTLGFSAAAGFRCGTASPFLPFDLERRAPFGFVERPLVLMDTTILAELDGDEGPARALATIRRLQEACSHHDGEFVFLWHNSSLTTTRERVLFEACHDP